MSPPRGRKMVKLNALTFSLMLDSFLDGPATITELCDLTGVSRCTMLRWIKALRAAHCVYISDWEKDSLGRVAIAVFTLGRGKDARKRIVTPKIARQRWRNKQKAQLTFTQAINPT